VIGEGRKGELRDGIKGREGEEVKDVARGKQMAMDSSLQGRVFLGQLHERRSRYFSTYSWRGGRESEHAVKWKLLQTGKNFRANSEHSGPIKKGGVEKCGSSVAWVHGKGGGELVKSHQSLNFLEKNRQYMNGKKSARGEGEGGKAYSKGKLLSK